MSIHLHACLCVNVYMPMCVRCVYLGSLRVWHYCVCALLGLLLYKYHTLFNIYRKCSTISICATASITGWYFFQIISALGLGLLTCNRDRQENSGNWPVYIGCIDFNYVLIMLKTDLCAVVEFALSQLCNDGYSKSLKPVLTCRYDHNKLSLSCPLAGSRSESVKEVKRLFAMSQYPRSGN